MGSIYQAGNVASSEASFTLDGNGRLALVINGQTIDLYGSFYSQVQFSDGVVTLPANGTTELQVNTTTAGDQTRPMLARVDPWDDVRDYLASWLSGNGIYVQQFKPDDQKSGGQTLVATNGFAGQVSNFAVGIFQYDANTKGYVALWTTVSNGQASLHIQYPDIDYSVDIGGGMTLTFPKGLYAMALPSGAADARLLSGEAAV